MSENLPLKPDSRRDFKIAIICALPIEADMVQLTLDHEWDVKYGKARGDFNSYTCGVLSDFNVVLAHCPGIGNNSAAQVAAGLRFSFTEIKIAVVVGVCGVMPFNPETREEIFLGDCIISTAAVQYDLGRLGPEGFKRKDGLDGLGRASIEIRALISRLQTKKNRLELTEQLASHLKQLQFDDPDRTQFPGRQQDRLFQSSCIHKHQEGPCDNCDMQLGICEKDCGELGCDEKRLAARKEHRDLPRIQFGCFGSANTVLKSGEDRDKLAQADKVIAFEMEGSGVWDVYPTIVIKGACDYADSHKNKRWQEYAAAVAAAGLKAFLRKLDLADEEITQDGSIQRVANVESMNAAFVQLDMIDKPNSRNKITRIFLVPDLLSPYFTGRRQELANIEEVYRTSKTEGPSRCIIHGMPGLGKTQMALKFANAHRYLYSFVFWVSGASSEKLDSGLSRILDELELKAQDQQVKNLLCRRWFENQDEKWLLIVDNVNEETMSYLTDLLPVTNAKGNILITTRFKVVAEKLVFSRAEKHATIELENLGLQDATDMFFATRNTNTSIDKSTTTEQSIARAIVKRVGCLPLAIDQAASLSMAIGHNIEKVLQIYEGTTLDDVMEWKSETSRYEASSVMASFKPLLDQVQQSSQEACDLLRLTAFLDPESISIDIIREGVVGFKLSTLEGVSQISTSQRGRRRKRKQNPPYIPTDDTDLGGTDCEDIILRLQAIFKLPVKLQQIFQVLTKLSLVKSKNTDGSVFWIHDLVHILIRQNLMNKEQQIKWLELTIDVIYESFRCTVGNPRDIKQRGKIERFIAHIQKLQGCSSEQDYSSQKLLTLGLWIASYLEESGRYEESGKFYEKMLAAKQLLSVGKPETIAFTKDGLAMIYRLQGRWKDAEKLALEVVTSRKESVGAEHGSTLASMHNLAGIYLDQGRWAEAEKLQLKVLETSRKKLGPEHRATLQTMNNLAGTYSDQGRLVEAEKLQLEIYQARKRLFGSEHSDTLESAHCLAVTYGEQGRYEEAEKLQVEVIEARKRDLGPSHPRTLNSLHSFACILSDSNRIDEAVDLIQTVIAQRTKILGPEHPDTLVSMHLLACNLPPINRIDDAVKLTEEVVEKQEKVIGNDHPQTLSSMHSLACMLQWNGKEQEAITLLKRVVLQREASIGRDNPQTQKSARLLFEWTGAEPTLTNKTVFEEETLDNDLPADRLG